MRRAGFISLVKKVPLLTFISHTQGQHTESSPFARRYLSRAHIVWKYV